MAAHPRRAADARPSSTTFTQRGHAPHDAARELRALLRRAARRTRTRCRSAPPRSARWRRSTSSPRPSSTIHDTVIAPDREDADDRGLLLQALDRPAVHLPAEPTSTTASNFLHMMFATPVRGLRGRPGARASALDLLLILHADHEQNCSTSTVRMVGSSQANLFASIAAGISALWGPLHGGANQQVIEMLERIEAEGGDAQKFVERAKDKKDNTPADGLRPPRLQELRSARGDPQEGLQRRARRARRQQPPARDRDEARGDRAQATTTSSATSSTRTSTSTPASSTRRSASR